jgi:hypothetical protein
MSKGIFVDASTGETLERELTPEEIAANTRSDAEKAAELTADQKVLRLGAYQTEADPLYFGWQRGENTEQEWLDKVAEIRARYPYPA